MLMGNVTGGVAAKFAFFPPDPPTYHVREEENERVVFSGIAADRNMVAHVLKTKSGNKIVATFWRHPSARFTLLYSHGNAADLGQMHELFNALRAHLRLNIMGYVCMFLSFFLFGFQIVLYSGLHASSFIHLFMMI